MSSTTEPTVSESSNAEECPAQAEPGTQTPIAPTANEPGQETSPALSKTSLSSSTTGDVAESQEGGDVDAPIETGEPHDEADSGQGEKRKEPDALADTPTQEDGTVDDSSEAPAKKQKTDDEPTAPETSAETSTCPE